VTYTTAAELFAALGREVVGGRRGRRWFGRARRVELSTCNVFTPGRTSHCGNDAESLATIARIPSSAPSVRSGRVNYGDKVKSVDIGPWRVVLTQLHGTVGHVRVLALPAETEVFAAVDGTPSKVVDAASTYLETAARDPDSAAALQRWWNAHKPAEAA
jgi:hypothetical protein